MRSRADLSQATASSQLEAGCGVRDAYAMSALEGTQPVHRHSPPNLLRSIKAALAPSAAAPAAVTRPAVPPPMTMMSWVVAVTPSREGLAAPGDLFGHGPRPARTDGAGGGLGPAYDLA